MPPYCFEISSSLKPFAFVLEGCPIDDLSPSQSTDEDDTIDADFGVERLCAVLGREQRDAVVVAPAVRALLIERVSSASSEDRDVSFGLKCCSSSPIGHLWPGLHSDDNACQGDCAGFVGGVFILIFGSEAAIDCWLRSSGTF